ncbi:hypothetical protein ALO94_200292 [Pseudomonas syringae pv. spinaceae]|uniref:Uncharacterized protein n=1 Tax=Pseudomonas syringae pv. spinaceae TaxID=264459 RepID=A0A0N8T9Q1_PSESX|nr:hypothetical protein ALO94_200292 [Pseudomonas syringae pv. spinaceae]
MPGLPPRRVSATRPSSLSGMAVSSPMVNWRLRASVFHAELNRPMALLADSGLIINSARLPSRARLTSSVLLASGCLICRARHWVSAAPAEASRPCTCASRAFRESSMALSNGASLIARSACNARAWPSISNAPISAGSRRVYCPLPSRLANAGICLSSAGMFRLLRSTLSCTAGNGRMRACLPIRSSATPIRQAAS